MTAKLIDENFQQHIAQIPKKAPSMLVHKSEHLLFVDSNLSCDTFNIIHLFDDKGLTINELSFAVNHFQKKALDYCLWTSEDQLSGQTQEFLKKLGLQKQNEEIGMVLDLNDYHLNQVPDSTPIRRVTSTNGLSDYSTVIAHNWNPPDHHIKIFYQTTKEIYLESSMIFLVYYIDQTPVSTLEMCPSNDEIIGFYSFATLVAYRRRGIGSSMMRHALHLAKQLNYKTVVLQAEQAAIGIYQQMGFNKINVYFEFAATP